MKKSLSVLLLTVVLLLSALPVPAMADAPAYTLLLGLMRYTSSADGAFTPALPKDVSFSKENGIPVLHLNGYRGTTVEFSAANAAETQLYIDISGKVSLAGGVFVLCGPEGLSGAVGFNQPGGQILLKGSGQLHIGMTGEYPGQVIAVYADRSVSSFVPVSVAVMNEKTAGSGAVLYSNAGFVDLFDRFSYHYTCPMGLKNARFAPGEVRIGGNGLVDVGLFSEAKSGGNPPLFSKSFGSGNRIVFRDFKGAAYFHTDGGPVSDAAVFDTAAINPERYYLYNVAAFEYESADQLQYAPGAAVIFRDCADSAALGLKRIGGEAFEALNESLDGVIVDSPLEPRCESDAYYASLRWYAPDEDGSYMLCDTLVSGQPSRAAVNIVPKPGYYFDYGHADPENMPVHYAESVSRPVESVYARHFMEFSFPPIEKNGPVVGVLGERLMMNGTAVQFAPKLVNVPENASFQWYMYINGRSLPLEDTDFGGGVLFGAGTPVLTVFNNDLETAYGDARFWLQVDVFGYPAAASTDGWVRYHTDKPQNTASEIPLTTMILSGLPLPTEEDPAPAFDNAEELYFDGHIRLKSVSYFRDVYGEGDVSITLVLQAVDSYYFNLEAYLEWAEYEAAGLGKYIAAARVISDAYENDTAIFTVDYAIPAPEEVPPLQEIEALPLEAAAPEAGQSPDCVTASMRKAALREADAAYALTDIRWTSGDGMVLAPDGVFEPGVDYTATFYLCAAPGYTFTGNTAATVNGERAEKQLLSLLREGTVSEASSGTKLAVSYTFYAAPVREISEVIASPVAGMHPDISAVGAENAEYKIEDVRFLPSAEVFAPGEIYTVTLDVSAVPGIRFDPEATAFINGAKAGLTLLSPDRARVTYTFTAAPTWDIAAGETEARVIRGDVDENFAVTAADARLALRASVGLETYASGSRAAMAADVNRDGKITAADARLILRAAVGLEKLPL